MVSTLFSTPLSTILPLICTPHLSSQWKLRLVAAVVRVTFDLCSIFDIENNWNSVLEQSGKPRQEEEEVEGGGSRSERK